jgi:transcription elongation factor GreB
MSKAFTKENDDDDTDDLLPDIEPTATINYVTPQGFAALQNELRSLMREERPKVVEIVRWAASNGDRSENGDYIYGKKRLREIDRRARYLTKTLENSKVVDPEGQKNLAKIFFGATVTYSGSNQNQKTLKIVGIDEADINQGKISWTSPVAKALMKLEVGDIAKVKTPSGEQILKILAIKYL